MKFKIIAAAPDDGWGFVSEEEKIFLLRPPYTSSDEIEVSMKVVENAIHIRGFEECDITLDTINEVVRSQGDVYRIEKEAGHRSTIIGAVERILEVCYR
ncbi:MAG: hypothetical protein U9Q68_04830 [Euryarchaeota archaeon]|nr:hypothetical protein [Euryarchaeota archaeon]